MSETIELELIPKYQVHPKTYLSANGFYIYDCKTESTDVELNSRGFVGIKGKIQRLDLNQTYKAELKFAETHETFGTSYWVESIYQDIPETPEAQKEYLLAIITQKQVDEIYKVYPNDDIISLFEKDTFDHTLVHGFGEKVYLKVKNKIIENLKYKELYSELNKYGVTPNLIQKIVDAYGSPERALHIVKENTYDLTSIKGIGFKKADTIFLSIAKSDLSEKLENNEITRTQASELFEEACRNPYRIKAGIVYAIQQEQNNGHTYMIRESLNNFCYELLSLDTNIIDEQIDENSELFVYEDKVSLISTYMAEQTIAQKSVKILKNSRELDFDPDTFIAEMEHKYKDELKHGLSEQQKSFIHNIKRYNIQLLIGFAGTGKSQMQKLLRELLTQLGLTSLWLTPTASAAKVLTSYLGQGAKAYTMHRGISMGSLTKENDDGQEEVIGVRQDFIIIDEFSMVDVFLCSRLLKLLKNPNVRVLFVGDSFQNVAISCGNILQNMIDAKVLPMTMLDVVFRQSEGGILDIATRIRLSEQFIEDDFVGTVKFGDNLLFHCLPYEYKKPSEFIDDGFQFYYEGYLDGGYKPEDILAMSPTKKGKLGTITLNKRIQNLVNPLAFGTKEIDFVTVEKNENEEDDIPEEPIKLRVGDYIVNTRNTYDHENLNGKLCDIVNGDTGILTDIIQDWKPSTKPSPIQLNPFDDDYFGEVVEEDDSEETETVVEENMNGLYLRFDEDSVKFKVADKFQLLHAWCMTIHKAQGMGNKAMLLVFDMSHVYGSNANMIYVALTRPEEYAIVVCQPKALNAALKKFANLMRNTHLERMLIECNALHECEMESIQEKRRNKESEIDVEEEVVEEVSDVVEDKFDIFDRSDDYKIIDIGEDELPF